MSSQTVGGISRGIIVAEVVAEERGGRMPVFAVRSVDGQLGLVAARNRADAVERLDEFANFEGCPMRELPELMLLLDMNDEGQFTLEHLGEEMDVAIRTFAYPLVEKAFDNVLDQQEAGQRDAIDQKERTPTQKALIRRAVEAERDRVQRKQMAEPLTERGREVKRQLDLPTSLLRKQERRVARAVLKREEVPKDPRKRH
ncbi:MAG: hypothetical protein HYX77_03455 [Acidobacteria bacterium]|nr:hypothetical protein [Acidobacteriota bacterium]